MKMQNIYFILIETLNPLSLNKTALLSARNKLQTKLILITGQSQRDSAGKVGRGVGAGKVGRSKASNHTFAQL